MTAKRRVLITGSTGLIGSAVAAALREKGDVVVRFVRGPATPPAVSWDQLTTVALTGFDAVVHLAGEPLANARWTSAKKAAIRDSRVDGTTRLVAAFTAGPPAVFVCASGINYYGDHGDQIVDESIPAGHSFLADTCVAWEAATAPLREKCRVVNLRIGAVLTPAGGTLAALLPVFRKGLGGPVAGGHRYMSWVTLTDTVRAIQHVFASPKLHGPVNVVTAEPVTNGEFTAALAAAVHRPALIPVPGWVARLALGEFADETALTSIRAVPGKLLEDGFEFEHPSLRPSLTAMLDEPRANAK